MIGGIVVVALLLTGLGTIAALVIRGGDKDIEKEVKLALAGRPGWALAPAQELEQRYRRASPFSFKERTFGGLLRGPLPGGLSAETFHVLFGDSHDRYHHRTSWTVATVVFPYPLPTASLTVIGDAAVQESGPGGDVSYAEATHGPAFAGLRGFATDPKAAAALFTPAVLGRTRALRADWRMDGRALVAVVREPLPKPAMMTLVDNMAWLGTLLPPQVRETAALQPDPWPGPTVERPA